MVPPEVHPAYHPWLSTNMGPLNRIVRSPSDSASGQSGARDISDADQPQAHQHSTTGTHQPLHNHTIKREKGISKLETSIK